MSALVVKKRGRGYSRPVVIILFSLGFDDLSVGSVLSDAFDAVFAAVLLDIALACSDYLAVAGFEAEAELASLVLIDLEFRVGLGLEALNGLVLDISDRSVLCNACNAVLDACEGVVDLAADSDDLAVSGFKAESEASLGSFDYKFAHNIHTFHVFREQANCSARASIPRFTGVNVKHLTGYSKRQNIFDVHDNYILFLLACQAFFVFFHGVKFEKSIDYQAPP